MKQNAVLKPTRNPGRIRARQRAKVACIPVGQSSGTRHLRLRDGQTAAIDADVFTTASPYSWRLGAGGYVVRTGEDGRTIYLHRAIMIAPAGMLVTFLNGDPLDLRRTNLRVVHRSDIPRRRRTRSASGLRGVLRNPLTGRFAARIRAPGQGKQLWLQEFDAPEAAAECYDAFARAFFGELAILNFPMERFDPMQYRPIPAQFYALPFVDAHSPAAMDEDGLTGQSLPSTIEDSGDMSTEREQDTLTMWDGTPPSAQHAGSVESAAEVYAGIVADARVVAPAPDYGNLFVVSGSSPPAHADCPVAPSAERDHAVEPSTYKAPANTLATQAFSSPSDPNIADFSNQFEPQPVRTGVRQRAAGSDTLVVKAITRPLATAGAQGPVAHVSIVRATGERAANSLNSGAAPTPPPHLEARPMSRSKEQESSDLFAVPPPVPTVAEGRRYRRSARRQEQYWARNRDTNMCAQCGRFPRKSPTHSRCERCCEAQRRSTSKRKHRNISQSTAHQPQTDLDSRATTVTLGTTRSH